ncbi:MAG: glycosyltransferase family 2 protein [Candidatus Roizmanbacteria bacterium]
MTKLAITTSNYNTKGVTDEFLSTLEKQKNRDFHVFLVDVSREKYTYKEYPWLTVIYAENKGYSWNVNVGIKAGIKAGFNLFAEINSDTEVNDDFVDRVMTSLKYNPTSIIGAKIYYFEGYEYHKDRYSSAQLGSVLWYAGGSIDWNHILTPHRGVDEVDEGQYDHSEKTGFITGCFMAFTKETYEKVGPWDENYFLYYEDAEWSQRALKKGVTLLYDPTIVIYHKNGMSTEGSGSKVQVNYQERNRLRFGLTYAPLRTKIHLVKNYLWEKIFPKVY